MDNDKDFFTSVGLGMVIGALTLLFFIILVGMEVPNSYTPVCLDLMEHADTVQVMKDHRICRNAIF